MRTTGSSRPALGMALARPPERSYPPHKACRDALLLFGWIGGQQGFVLYHFVNPFNVFNFEFEATTTALTVGLALVIGIVVYRPFCLRICRNDAIRYQAALAGRSSAR